MANPPVRGKDDKRRERADQASTPAPERKKGGGKTRPAESGVAPKSPGKKIIDKSDTKKKGRKRTSGKSPNKDIIPKSRKRSPIRIGGRTIPPGTKSEIHLKVSEHYTAQKVDIPVTVIRGRRAGPRLFLTAAVHGDEVNGVQIIREVIDQIEAETIRGTIIAAPVVNRFGFVSHSRYMPDRRDLNRVFPGDPKGNTSQRYAHNVFKHIINPCDYGIDLHTAGYQRHNLPQVRGDMSNDEVRRLAKAFGAEVILDKRGAKGTLRQVATDHGVPTIIYEAGETFRFQRDVISQGVTGILNVMRELNMLAGEPVRPRYQVITKTSAWVRTDHGGLMETFVQAGSVVHKGELIGIITNPFGQERGQILAPFTGIVVGVTLLPMVNPGAPICHMVKLKKTLRTVREHVVPESVPIEGEVPFPGFTPTRAPGEPEEEEIEG
ncbi:MAG: succinylglutamate desuccinylase/aspartoacylase family protein [Euryarchaeota archaeon]|nr:succinylglutamate desuccinylase/aspartoacylase family protein [Euryarchaeota archaeon]